MDIQIGQQYWKFNGGLKLRHWKKLSIDRGLSFAGIPETLYLAVTQHQGTEAEPTVEIGQKVLKGQLIASSHENTLGSRLHAPTSGLISAISNRPVIHESGLPALCIELIPDQYDQSAPWVSHPDWQQLNPQSRLAMIADAGIVGLGGAVFPTHVKLQKPIQALIINGAECEPYIACDESLMRDNPQQLILACQMMRDTCGADQAVIAVEDQMGAVEHLLNQAKQELKADDIKILKVPTIYPEGGERQLIKVLTGLEVPTEGHPHDIGLVCLNVATVVSAYRAVTEGRPLISRIVSLTGRGIAEPQNFEVLLGTRISDLVALAGGYTDQAQRLVVGGPMMGIAIPNDDYAISKSSNCVVALVDDDIQQKNPEVPCIRCMDCVTACPAQLLPQQLFAYIRHSDYEQAQQHQLFDCIECGCCAYVCPSQIPLVDYYRHAKSEIKAQQNAQQHAKHAKLRFEARNQRLVQQEEQTNLRRLEKQKALNQDSNNQAGLDPIAAAVARAKARKKSKQS